MKAVFENCCRRGVNSFDTSLPYGDSEAVLGDFSSELSSLENPVLTTKFKVTPEII